MPRPWNSEHSLRDDLSSRAALAQRGSLKWVISATIPLVESLHWPLLLAGSKQPLIFLCNLSIGISVAVKSGIA